MVRDQNIVRIWTGGATTVPEGAAKPTRVILNQLGVQSSVDTSTWTCEPSLPTLGLESAAPVLPPGY